MRSSSSRAGTTTQARRPGRVRRQRAHGAAGRTGRGGTAARPPERPSAQPVRAPRRISGVHLRRRPAGSGAPARASGRPAATRPARGRREGRASPVAAARVPVVEDLRADDQVERPLRHLLGQPPALDRHAVGIGEPPPRARHGGRGDVDREQAVAAGARRSVRVPIEQPTSSADAEAAALERRDRRRVLAPLVRARGEVPGILVGGVELLEVGGAHPGPHARPPARRGRAARRAGSSRCCSRKRSRSRRQRSRSPPPTSAREPAARAPSSSDDPARVGHRRPQVHRGGPQVAGRVGRPRARPTSSQRSLVAPRRGCVPPRAPRGRPDPRERRAPPGRHRPRGRRCPPSRPRCGWRRARTRARASARPARRAPRGRARRRTRPGGSRTSAARSPRYHERSIATPVAGST